jgi:hypothetical protein
MHRWIQIYAHLWNTNISSTPSDVRFRHRNTQHQARSVTKHTNPIRVLHQCPKRLCSQVYRCASHSLQPRSAPLAIAVYLLHHIAAAAGRHQSGGG